jgi:hypothetical protein
MNFTKHILQWDKEMKRWGRRNAGGGGGCWFKFGFETSKACCWSEADFIEVL